MTGRPTHSGWDVNYIRHIDQTKSKKRELVHLIIS
jgi:hypothetical protein